MRALMFVASWLGCHLFKAIKRNGKISGHKRPYLPIHFFGLFWDLNQINFVKQSTPHSAWHRILTMTETSIRVIVCAKCCILIIVRVLVHLISILLLSHCIEEKLSTDTVSNLPIVTQLVSGKARIMNSAIHVSPLCYT